jgi:hypothetical protein
MIYLLLLTGLTMPETQADKLSGCDDDLQQIKTFYSESCPT